MKLYLPKSIHTFLRNVAQLHSKATQIRIPLKTVSLKSIQIFRIMRKKRVIARPLPQVREVVGFPFFGEKIKNYVQLCTRASFFILFYALLCITNLYIIYILFKY